MGKNSNIRGSGPSRVRFVMLEAELNEGDLGPFTQAIQNALRPVTQPATSPRALAQRMTSPPGNSEIAEPAPVDGEIEEVALSPEPQEARVQARPVGPRKLRTPKVLDLDLTSGTAFAAFAQTKNPSSDQLRFLVVAAWFKEHRDSGSITADHVYTCYRAVNWPSGIEDFSAPLRALKHQQFLAQTGKGAYSINHLGLAKVEKLGAG